MAVVLQNVLIHMPKRKKINLADIEQQFDMSGPQCATFFGYDRKHWVKMRTHPKENPIQDRLLFSIEAHLKLSPDEIEALKKSRLSPK